MPILYSAPRLPLGRARTGCYSILTAQESRRPDARKPKLLERVREAIRTRHSSRRTEKASVGWIRRFIDFHDKRHPAEMGGEEIPASCLSLAVEAG
jgi:hypothetical protein